MTTTLADRKGEKSPLAVNVPPGSEILQAGYVADGKERKHVLIYASEGDWKVAKDRVKATLISGGPQNIKKIPITYYFNADGSAIADLGCRCFLSFGNHPVK